MNMKSREPLTKTLSHLYLQRISERALDGLNTLKTLNLRRNLLKKLDSGIFRGTPALLSINLQDNPLETLTYFSFQPIMDNLVNSTSELLLSGKFLSFFKFRLILLYHPKTISTSFTFHSLPSTLRSEQ